MRNHDLKKIERENILNNRYVRWKKIRNIFAIITFLFLAWLWLPESINSDYPYFNKTGAGIFFFTTIGLEIGTLYWQWKSKNLKR